MSNPVSVAKLTFALPVAGTIAAVLSAVILGIFSVSGGLPPWMPLNATSHVWHGPAAAEIPGMTWRHTAFGTTIHVCSAFFWTAVAILLLRATGSPRTGATWAVSLGTAALAGAIDYGLMPARLTPGWELVLPNSGVVAGFVGLGIGIAFGLNLAQRPHGHVENIAGTGQTVANTPKQTHLPQTELERMRRPAPTELDQRQQRIDPAGKVTADLNWRDDRNTKQPGGSNRPKRPKQD